MQITVNGVSLHYDITGPESAPWLTFSNSLATNLTMWDDQVAALKSDFRILRYDKRGHGGSEGPEGPYTFDMLVDDVVGLWDALGIDACHFVGLSIGGMTALGLALNHASRLHSITVANARADAPPAFKDAWDQRIAVVKEQGIAALADATVERWSSPSFFSAKPLALAKLRSMVATTSPAGFIGCARALQMLNYQSQLSAIRMPTLFIAGKEDIATPADTMRQMQGLVAGSHFAELSPAGHISNVEQPEAFTTTVREFIATIV